MPASYDELMNGWDLKYRPKFQMMLDIIKNENLIVFFERIDISILRKENSSSQQMIWMNYKLLEAEVERLKALDYIADNVMPHVLNVLDACCDKLNSDDDA